MATLFPEYLNKDGAAGFLDLDTTAYANGVHTIGWIVTDDGANSDGIGSRFFTIVNTNGSSTAGATMMAMRRNAEDLTAFPMDFSPVEVFLGFAPLQDARRIHPNGATGLVLFSMEEISYLRLNLVPDDQSTRKYSGYLQVGNALRALPAGSTLDTRNGVFYWQPGPGFLGDYDLVFVDEVSGRRRLVRVSIIPRHYPINTKPIPAK